MKKLFILILIVSLIIIFLVIYIFVLIPQRNTKDIDNAGRVEQSAQNFTLISQYKGDRNWDYTVTGKLPNPCYTATAEAIIRESYPEQVSVTVTVTEPDIDSICAEVITDYEQSGTFTADEKATVTLTIK